MSLEYAPRVPPQTPEELLPYLDDEFLRIAQVLNRTLVGEHTILYTPPTRIVPGLVVYADGVSWNPGGGEGLYRRTLANIWTRVG
jgi:hypothetical protein